MKDDDNIIHAMVSCDRDMAQKYLKNERIHGITEASVPWHKKSKETILDDLTSSMNRIKENSYSLIEPDSILIIGPSDMSRKVIVRKVVDQLNREHLLNITFKEVDNFLELKRDEIMVLKDPMMEQFDDDFPKEEKPIKSKNFRDRPSIPSKKRKWKK